MGFGSVLRWASLIIALALVLSSAWASDLVIRVSRIEVNAGEITGAMFSCRRGDPMHPSNARQMGKHSRREGISNNLTPQRQAQNFAEAVLPGPEDHTVKIKGVMAQ